MASRSWHNDGVVIRQYYGVSTWYFFKEEWLWLAATVWDRERDPEQHLQELTFGPPAPLAPLTPLATLNNFKMWSPEGRRHKYLVAPNLPPSLLQIHQLFVTEDLERGISPGEGEGLKPRHVWRESGQSAWRVSFSPVTQHLMTQCADQFWAQPHGSRSKMCHQKSCGNICVLYYFVSSWA